MPSLAHLWSWLLAHPAAQDLVAMALGALVLKFVPGLPGLTTRGSAWLGIQISKMRPGFAKDVLSRVNQVVLARVLVAENTAVEDLKSAMVNGSLSPAALPGALAKMKADTLAAIKKDLSAQGLWELALYLVFGGSEPAFLAHLDTSLEAHVSTLPASGLQSGSAGFPAATHISQALTAASASPQTLPAAK